VGEGFKLEDLSGGKRYPGKSFPTEAKGGDPGSITWEGLREGEKEGGQEEILGGRREKHFS